MSAAMLRRHRLLVHQRRLQRRDLFVGQACFMGAKDPCKALKTMFKAEEDEEAWTTLHIASLQTFRKTKSGQIAVTVIHHLGVTR